MVSHIHKLIVTEMINECAAGVLVIDAYPAGLWDTNLVMTGN